MHAPRRTARDLRSAPRVRIDADTATAFGGVPTHQETPMQWTRPAFEDLRFGFEITMYIASR
jgi:pyrroloquinoline quinone biosynthesis protein A